MASPSSSTPPVQPEASTSSASSSRLTPERNTTPRAGGSAKRSRSPASSPSSTAQGSSTASPASDPKRSSPSASASPSRGGHGPRQGVVGRAGSSPSSTSPSPSASPSATKKPAAAASPSTSTPTKSRPTSTHTPLSSTPTSIPDGASHLLSTPPGRSGSLTGSSSPSSSTSPSLALDSSSDTTSTSIVPDPDSSNGRVGSSSDSVADVDEMLEDPLSGSPTHDRSGSGSPLKKVKVYELRNDSWFDRGTGHVHGLYDEGADQAILVVTAEESSPDPEEDVAAGGGFVKDDDDDQELNMEDRATIRTIRSKGVEGKILMHSHIQGKDVYQRQQDTLIVWTEPNGTDIALSFADPNDCENVWEFVLEVQKMLDSGMEEDIFVSSSPPLGMRSVSPALGRGGRQRQMLQKPSFGQLDTASEQIRTLARNMLGRERLVEAVVKEDYLKMMAETFDTAEDLESIGNLHTLFTMMQTILFLNDTTVIEYLLQETFFMSVLGMLEYDPEFPKLKASYRDFLRNSTRFREAVPIKDESIRAKIHQTYRLLYLKDVVLARVLEESTMNIINSMIFFNQNDIVQHMQGNTQFLVATFEAFVPEKIGPLAPKTKRAKGKGPLGVKRTSGTAWMDDDDDDDSAEDTEEDSPVAAVAAGKENAKPPLGDSSSATLSASTSSTRLNAPKQFPDSHKRDVVLLLHQLLLMSKNIQLPSRLQLVRTLLEHGLVYVLEWAFSTRSNPAPTPSSAVPSSDDPLDLFSSGSDATIAPPAPGSAIPPPDADQIPNAAVEMLTHALDHDPSAVRTIVLAEFARVEAGAKTGGSAETTLVVEIVKLLVGESRPVAVEGGGMDVDAKDGATSSSSATTGERKVTGFKSQLADALKQLLDTGEPDATFTRGPQKDGPIAESFLTYFYENCVDDLMRPLLDLPDFHTLKGSPLSLTPENAALLLSLCDLLSFFSANHGHRSQYFILSGTMNTKVGCLLNAREKPLRHAAIRFFRACLKINTHYMFRYLNKGDVFAPVLELLARASPRDNMLSSACLELFEFIRKENLKAILDHLLQGHEERIRLLATRPLLKACFTGLITKWEQNNEPPPEPDFKAVEEDTKRRHDETLEDDYFRDSDDDLAAGPSTSTSSFLSSSYTLPSTHSSTSLAQLGPKRKRQKGQQGDSKAPASGSSSSSSDAAPLTPRPKTPAAVGLGLGLGLGLDLDYGDDDDDDENDELIPITDTSLGSSDRTTLTSISDHDLPSSIEPIPPAPAPAPAGNLDQPIKDWKRRREDAEEEDDQSFLSSLMSGGRGRGGKGHKRSTGSVGGEAKEARPLPATPGSTTTEGGGKKEDAKAEDGEKKSGGGFKFSLKPFKMGGGSSK